MTEPPLSSEPTAIRLLGAAEAEVRLPELADILVDAVAYGGSVNFLAGFSLEQARAFWSAQLPAFADGSKRLLVGDDGRRLVGTVMVMFALQPNGLHRAEVGKMLVHSTARRQGLGQRLLTAAEDTAREAGRTLLILDTEAGSAGDRLYRRCGWTVIGSVPGYALNTAGKPAAATLFYKVLAP